MKMTLDRMIPRRPPDLTTEGVEVWQTGRDSFIVRYGKQVSIGLDYANATKEFGKCVFHAAVCSVKFPK